MTLTLTLMNALRSGSLAAELPELSAELPELSAELPELPAELPDLSAGPTGSYRFARQRRSKVYLTFDDGPICSDEACSSHHALLEDLDKLDIKASFFVVAEL